MGGDLVDLQSDYEKKFQSQVNLPTTAATKHSFVNPEVKRGQDPRDAQGTNSVKDEHQASSYVAREFLRSMSNIQQQQQRQIKMMVDMQGQQHDQLYEVLTYHREMAASMSLSDVEAPIIDGKPIEYCHFVRALENLFYRSFSTWCNTLQAKLKTSCKAASQ